MISVLNNSPTTEESSGSEREIIMSEPPVKDGYRALEKPN
jgi:hypothetical protein